MTPEEIAAAHDSVIDSFGLVTSLFTGNMEAVFIVAGVVAVVGILALIIRGLYAAVGLRRY